MKKSIYLSILAAFSALLLSSNAMSQAAREGNFIIDPYYGGPNFGKAFLNLVEDNANNASNVETGGIGPAGLRLEYMIGSQIGLGVDVIYNSNNITYTETDSIYNSNENEYQVQTDEYEQNMRRLRVHVRFNYHFDITNPDLDGYAGIGAGTNNRFRSAFRNGDEIDDPMLNDNTLIPVSARICAGMRYYFTENLGLNLELGLGGPVISGGLSLKL